jgi:hypothetical protein
MTAADHPFLLVGVLVGMSALIAAWLQGERARSAAPSALGPLERLVLVLDAARRPHARLPSPPRSPEERAARCSSPNAAAPPTRR